MATEKLSEVYSQRFTPGEMLDLVHEAHLQDRGSVPELVRFIVRRWLYGNRRRPTGDVQHTNSGFQQLRDEKD